MEYRNLGSSGTKVSVIGLGTNNFGRRLNSSDTKKVIDTAIDEGINFLDTSNSYGDTLSEEYIGNAIKTTINKTLTITQSATTPDGSTTLRFRVCYFVPVF